MRKRVLMAFVAALLAAPVWAAEDTQKSCCKSKRACTSKRAVPSSKLRCSLTGTVVESCCCVRREGKLYCTLAGQTVESCCCQSAAAKTKGSEEGPVEAATLR